MKNKILSLLLLVLSFGCGHFVGSHEFYMAADIDLETNDTSISYLHCYNVKESLTHEREYCNAWIELCHYFLYDNNPRICSECDSLLSPFHNNDYWLDVISETKYYDKINELNGGDWEDFDAFWN